MTEYGIMMMWCFLGPFIGFLIGGMWESQKTSNEGE